MGGGGGGSWLGVTVASGHGGTVGTVGLVLIDQLHLGVVNTGSLAGCRRQLQHMQKYRYQLCTDEQALL